MELVALILAGSAAGVVTGLIPGLHVNTLAAIAFAVMPTAGPAGAVFLLAVGTVHTIVNILPGTYLGVPDADEGISMLPAHQLLLQGRGPAAIRTSVAASLAALCLATLVAVGYRRAIHAGGNWLAHATVPILAMAVVGLWLQEWRRGGGLMAAMAIFAAAWGVGWLAFAIPLVSWVDLPASPFLPLLAGLFGAAGMSMALQRPPRIPTQSMQPRVGRPWFPVIAGTLAAGLTAVLPGLTSAVATSFTPGTRHSPVRAVAALSAVNTAHTVFALIVWMGTGRIRTGLADAADRWTQPGWSATMPEPSALQLLAVVTAAGALGAGATLVLERTARGHIHRIPSRGLAVAGLAALIAIVAILSGWTGLALFVLAALVGRIPLQVGLRRVHLVGALIGPAIMRAW